MKQLKKLTREQIRYIVSTGCFASGGIVPELGADVLPSEFSVYRPDPDIPWTGLGQERQVRGRRGAHSRRGRIV